MRRPRPNPAPELAGKSGGSNGVIGRGAGDFAPCARVAEREHGALGIIPSEAREPYDLEFSRGKRSPPEVLEKLGSPRCVSRASPTCARPLQQAQKARLGSGNQSGLERSDPIWLVDRKST